TMARYYLTTAIDYVNNRPHLGTAYEKIAADIIIRYHRLIGDEARLVMGNDEHSQNVFKRAKDQGLDPLAYCDRMEGEFREVWKRLDISFDDFIRTTEPRHKAAVQAMVQRSFDTGDIYEGVYEGWYCVSCEEFKPEKSLIDGLCPVHRTKPDWIKEKNYFFKLSKYRDALLEHYAAHPTFVEPASRRNEMLSLLNGGLEDISVSRAGQAWGIPLPFDSGNVVYVWYDALINYAAAVGYGSDDAMFAKWWAQADQPARHVTHLVGKDITRFHCVVWPAMLMSAGLPVPTQIYGHGWVTFKGEKMSKSLGTVVDPLEAADRLGPDPLRLYLAKEIVFGGDGDFSWDRFEEKYNADLANNLGNLVSRVTSMVHRYRSGTLAVTNVTPALEARAVECLHAYRREMDGLHLEAALAIVFQFADATNEYIASQAPWALAKNGQQAELDAVLWNATEALRVIALLLSPVMPSSSREILRRVGALDETTTAVELSISDCQFTISGTRTVLQRDALWPRLEAKEKPVSEPSAKPAEPSVTPVEPSTVPAEPTAPLAEPVASLWPMETRISIDDFMKIDLRIAKVLTAERVPKSKKLMKMSIDLGSEQRTLVAGIAEAYEPEQLVGRHVAIVANLKPATLMGIESNGMVLAASPDGGKPMLVSFDAPPAPGTRVR
ncbi:MAG: methionine--tRNA ligase, partial [Acidobacteria bacterium]|nr:methionine--tRNA ligase [Acidobacteriota bacterium]